MPTKGKKSVRWDQDPEILARLESVAQMMSRGARPWQIAEALDTSLITARRDIRRVRILWNRESKKEIERSRQESLVRIKAVQQQAWARYDAEPKKGYRWLRLVLECEKQVIDIEGSKAPMKVAPTDPTGKKPYDPADLSDEERLARVVVLLERARRRRDSMTEQIDEGESEKSDQPM
jgi:hypothetical protein